MNTTRILVNGAKGRMGRAIVRRISGFPNATLAAETDDGDSIEEVVDACDAVIDFSHHSVTAPLAELCARHSKTLVVGTTGQTEEQLATVRRAASSIPVVLAPNFSVGVNTLFWLTRKAAEILGGDIDLEVVEMHHRMKKDAPSGTAKRLGEILAEVRGLQYAEVARHGREGMVGERTDREIGMHALRGGDVVGDHTVVFAGPGERVELTHRAASRDTFANGSIRATLWAADQPAGLYDMQDVLGLK